MRLRCALAALFSLLFYAVYGGTSRLSAFRDPPPAPHFAFETAVPFVPWMAWIYLTVPLALGLAAIVLRTRREAVSFFCALTTQLLVAGLCYLLYPLTTAWPPRVAEGNGAAVFRFVDALNLDFNEVPSLHLAFAASVAMVLGRHRGRLVQWALASWVLAVAVSTLLLHEHHLLDVATGIALGILAVLLVQRPLERSGFLDTLRVEALCLGEMARFTRRHPRYLLTGLAIWGYSLRRWRETRLLRTGFCLAQHIDDVLDGDRPVPGDPGNPGDDKDPIAYARGLLRGEPGPLTPLAESVLGDLDRRGGHEKLDELVEVLIQDRLRMDSRRMMPAADLAAHHRRTFQLSLDLTLLAAGSNLRAEDAPELVEALTWCSPVRDLEDDLAKGLINIPEEVLARVPGVNAPRTLLASTPVQDWLRTEHRRGAEAIAALGRKARSPVLAAFHRALSAYEKKYCEAAR